MKKKNVIDQFVSSIYEFKTDDVLTTRGQVIQTNPSYYMAAASNKKATNMMNLGTLSNDDGKVMVRVFKDVEKEKYNLYFLSNDKRFTQFPILFEPTSFKYFIIHPDGHAEIPLSSVIDPVQQSLSISYPLMSNTFDLNHFESGIQDAEISVILHHGRMYVTLPKKGSKALFIFTADSGSFISRLVPIRNGEAIVSMPENTGSEVCISVFE